MKVSNEFRICDKCKAINVNSLVAKLKELDSDCTIKIGCQNFCGIGMTKPFVIVNNVPVISINEEELIDKIKEMIKDKRK